MWIEWLRRRLGPRDHSAESDVALMPVASILASDSLVERGRIVWSVTDDRGKTLEADAHHSP